MERILNLCDIGLRLKERMTFEELAASAGGVSRVYAGSYFCENYFLKAAIPVLEWCAPYCRARGIKAALVLPMASQRYLDECKEHLIFLERRYRDMLDMVCVNDLGMLCWAAEHSGWKVVLGRLFWKKVRDPRYPETCRLQKFTVSREMRRLLGESRAWGLELENLYETVEKGEGDYQIYTHTGLCYMSCMRECLYASVDKNLQDRFRTDTDCRLECSSWQMKNKIQNGYEIFRIGKGIYFPTDPEREAPEGADGVILYPREGW